MKKSSKSRSLFSEAIKLAERSDSPLQNAETQLEIGKIYLSYGLLNKKKVKKAKKYFEASYEAYSQANLPRKLEAAFWSGKANKLLKNQDEAIEFFEITINQASEKKSEQQYSMISRAFLVDLYSRAGEEEKATEQCQAIGKSQTWQENVEPKPLFTVTPTYPRKALLKRKQGYVTMEFTIDTSGFAKDISVIKQSDGNYFEEESKKVLSRWRFAPKFENGKAVDAVVRYTLEYKMAK